MVRVAPLSGLESMGLTDLKAKADDLWKKILRLETEKYDMEQRRARQDYDLRESAQANQPRRGLLSPLITAHRRFNNTPPTCRMTNLITLMARPEERRARRQPTCSNSARRGT